MDVFCDRHKLARCADEALVVLFGIAFGTIAVLASCQVWKVSSTWRVLPPILLTAGCVLFLILGVRIFAWIQLRHIRPTCLMQPAIFDLSRLVLVQARDPGWMPVRYVFLSIPILMLVLGYPLIGRDSSSESLETIWVGDLLELAPKQSTRVDWERKKIRVVGRIGNWPGNSGFMLLDYERRSRHPGWDIHALGNFVPVVIDRSSADEPADEEFQAPVEWGQTS